MRAASDRADIAFQHLHWGSMGSALWGATKAALRTLIQPAFLSTLALGILLVASSYSYADKPLALWLKKFDAFFLTGFFETITGLGRSIWLIGVSAAVAMLLVLTAFLLSRLSWAKEVRRRAAQALFVFACVAVPSMIGLILKIAIGRARPTLLFKDGIYGFAPFNFDWGFHSMPSGHSLAVVGLASGLALIASPMALPIIAFFATLIAFSRFLTTAHYLSDAIAGAVLAMLVAMVLKAMFRGAGADVFPSWEPRQRGFTAWKRRKR